MKKTQLETVKKQLLETGQVSRNWCLQNFISRLGAIACDLKAEGFELEGEYVKTTNGKDYVYKLKKSPYKRVEYRVEGRLVATKYEK
jgi:hypothetical protein